jgi:transposase
MAAPRKFPDELRERAVRLVEDVEQDAGSVTAACRRVGEQLGINADTLRNWVRQAQVDAGARPGRRTRAAAIICESSRYDCRVQHLEERVDLLAGEPDQVAHLPDVSWPPATGVGTVARANRQCVWYCAASKTFAARGLSASSRRPRRGTRLRRFSRRHGLVQISINALVGHRVHQSGQQPAPS